VSVRKAKFNGRQTGSLPPMWYSRDVPALDPVAGAYVAADTPYYGKPRGRCAFPGWAVSGLGVGFNWGLCGTDRDGSTPMACAKQTSGQPEDATLKVWTGSVAPTPANFVHEIDIVTAVSGSVTVNGAANALLYDIFQGHASQQADVAYWPFGGVTLPGCFVFGCERYVQTSPGVWDSEGVTVVKLQHTAAGAWDLAVVGDLNASPLESGHLRGALWSFAAYYPTTLNQRPLLDVFLCPCDYANGSDLKYGGQCAILRATRADLGSDWSFGPIVLLLEEFGQTAVHYHAAAWTPNGVVLSRGDSNADNENVLFQCADWDDYGEPGNWTTTRDAYGSRSPDNEYSFQWMGPQPHSSDLTRILVGADEGVSYGAVMTVAGDGAISYKKSLGDFPQAVATEDVNAFPSNKPAPEWSARSVRCAAPAGPIGFVTQLARVLYADDDEHFAAVALWPSTSGVSSFVFLYGHRILMIPKGTGGSIYEAHAPAVEPVRGLVVAPGGANVLDGFNAIGTPGGTFTEVAVASPDPEGTVHRVVADQVSEQIANWRATPAATVGASAAVWEILFVQANSAAGIPLRLTSETLPQGAGDSSYILGVAGIHDTGWRLLPVYVNAGAFDQSPYQPLVRLYSQSSGTNKPLCDYHLLYQGWYTSEGECPYLLEPGTSGSNIQVEVPLSPASGDAWTVGIEMFMPVTGLDFTSARTVVLATVYRDTDNYVEVVYDPSNAQVLARVFRDGVEELNSPLVVADVYVRHDDQLWIAVGSDGTTTHLWCAAGGYDETGLKSDSAAAAMAGARTSVRIGSADYGQVPNVELVMVADENAQLLSTAGVEAMMATAAEPSAARRLRRSLGRARPRRLR